MDVEHLKNVMKFHLGNFAKAHSQNNVAVSDETIHEDVLRTDDGIGNSNSKNIYRALVRWQVKREKAKDKPWPGNWMKITVADLASRLIILLLVLCSFAANSQLQVSLGAAKTDLKQGAITIGISYLRAADSAWKAQDFAFTGPHSVFLLTPQADIQTGNQDAFSSIQLKATGLFITFKTTKIDGVDVPNTATNFQTFPISLGVETDNLFNNINALLEVGWAPWYQTAERAGAEFLKHTRIGLFAQAGYKFRVDSTGAAAKGGQADQSLEKPNSAILRAKGTLGISSGAIVKAGQFRLELVCLADAWYDFLHSAVYDKIDGRGRIYFSGENYLDLIYQHGSGAPNFNQGNQFGIGLTITF